MSILRMVQNIKDFPGIYPVDEISTAELDFEKFSCSSLILFFTFSFNSVCLMVFTPNSPRWFVCLFVLVLWHFNLCRLFNAKCRFIQINSSISNNSV